MIDKHFSFLSNATGVKYDYSIHIEPQDVITHLSKHQGLYLNND